MSDPDSTNWFIQLFVTYKPVVDFLQALLAPVIAVTVGYIAYAQYKTNKQRLQLEQYDRRVKVYCAVRDFLEDVLHKDKTAEDVKAFNDARSESHFLFGDDISDYMDKVWMNYIGLLLCSDNGFLTAGTSEKEKKRIAEDRKEYVQFFQEQWEIAGKMFKKYLQLE